MSLTKIAQEIKRKERTLVIYNPPNDIFVADVKDYFENMNLRVTTQETFSTELTDSAHLRLQNNTIVTVSHSFLHNLITYGHLKRDNDKNSEADFYTFLKNIKLTTFTTTDIEQMQAVYDEIIDRANRAHSATLYISLHDGIESINRLREYNRLENQECPVILYTTPRQTVPNSDILHPEVVDVDEITRAWFAVCNADQQPTAKTALVALERGSHPFYGFWTDDPGIVDRIVAYLTSLSNKNEYE